jgi:hypothetical protein
MRFSTGEDLLRCCQTLRDDEPSRLSVLRLIHDWLLNENVSLGQVLLTDIKDFVVTITDNDQYPADGIVLQIVQGIQAKVRGIYLSSSGNR